MAELRGEGVELAAGFYFYLKHELNATITWRNTGGEQLRSVPGGGHLPAPRSPIVRHRNGPLFYGGFEPGGADCYTAAFWDWERWEREIDWMCVQGINLPVAPVGQEAIFRKVYLELGLTEREIEAFFPGPAYLGWNRLGNIKGWAGPLTDTWHRQASQLQAKILARMRALGMAAVLPAFHGHVPDAMQAHFPTATFTRLSPWGWPADSPFTEVLQLDPTDALFAQIGSRFITIMREEWPAATASRFYHPIVYEEEVPSSNSTVYLAEVGAAVFGAIAAVDPDAVWMVQGWTLHEEKASFWQPPQTKAFLTSGRTVVLDFFAEGDPGWIKTGGFYGVNWIWCMFQDGGQNYGLYGMTDSILANPLVAAAANSTMVGVGMVPEGYEANPAIFEMFSEVAFAPEQLEPVQWFEDWARRRYDRPPPAAVEAWRLLYTSGVYNCNNSHENHNTDFTISRPRLCNTIGDQAGWSDGHIDGSWPNWNDSHTYPDNSSHWITYDWAGGPFHLNEYHPWYDTAEFLRAWRLLLNASDDLSDQQPYVWDVVDVTREVLSKFVSHTRVLSSGLDITFD